MTRYGTSCVYMYMELAVTGDRQEVVVQFRG